MADKPTYTLPKLYDDGSQQWGIINKMFQDLYDLITEHANELKALAKHNTQTINFAISNNKATTILNGGKHFRAKITNAYVVLGDSAEVDTQVELIGISNLVKFTSTEKTGKIKIFELKRDTLHYIEGIQVRQSGPRKLLVGVTLESTEES